MTREEAAKILDPETTLDAYAKISYYGGFEGESAWQDAVNEACRMGAAALRELDAKENQKPLTLEELRQMNGEPVWIVEHPDWGHWELAEDADRIRAMSDEELRNWLFQRDCKNIAAFLQHGGAGVMNAAQLLDWLRQPVEKDGQ